MLLTVKWTGRRSSPSRPMLAIDRVRHVGDAVALVDDASVFDTVVRVAEAAGFADTTAISGADLPMGDLEALGDVGLTWGKAFGAGVSTGSIYLGERGALGRFEVAAIGDVRRAKLYYLRKRVGKKARVRELRQS